MMELVQYNSKEKWRTEEFNLVERRNEKNKNKL